MELSAFRRFASRAPNTIGEMLRRLEREPSVSTIEQVQVFLRALTNDSIGCLRSPICRDSKAVEAVAISTGTKPHIIQLAADIYGEYCYYASRKEWTMNEEEREYFLTGGHHSAEYAFLLNGALCGWEPKESEVYFHIEEDEYIFRDCCTYLKQKGASFASAQEAATFATLRGWPNGHLIKEQIDGC